MRVDPDLAAGFPQHRIKGRKERNPFDCVVGVATKSFQAPVGLRDIEDVIRGTQIARLPAADLCIRLLAGVEFNEIKVTIESHFSVRAKPTIYGPAAEGVRVGVGQKKISQQQFMAELVIFGSPTVAKNLFGPTGVGKHYRGN